MAKELTRQGQGRDRKPSGEDALGWLLHTPSGRVTLVALGCIGGVLLLRRVFANSHAAREIERKQKVIGTRPITQSSTMTTNRSQLLADKLYQAMDGNGTNEFAIHEVFNELKTDGDLKQLQQAFGVRSYGSTGGNESWIAKATGWAKPLSLDEWLREELSGEALRIVQMHYQRLGAML